MCAASRPGNGTSVVFLIDQIAPGIEAAEYSAIDQPGLALNHGTATARLPATPSPAADSTALAARRVQDEGMDDGEARGHWISYRSGPGGKDHLSPEDRALVEKREAASKARRGRLLCEVHVRVYEHDDADAEMYVSFPDGAMFSPGSGREQVSLAVARAREQLGRW